MADTLSLSCAQRPRALHLDGCPPAPAPAARLSNTLAHQSPACRREVFSLSARSTTLPAMPRQPILTFVPSWVQQRYVLSVMLLLAVMNMYTMRVCLSVAIVQMVSHDTPGGGDGGDAGAMVVVDPDRCDPPGGNQTSGGDPASETPVRSLPTGAQLGSVLGTAGGGLALHYLDWPATFYIFGALGMAWYVLWLLLCYSSPSEHPFISQEERDFLAHQIKQVGGESAARPRTPWRGILTSRPVWGLVVIQVGHDWGFFTLLTDLPKYMRSVLRFDIAQNGALSSLPYLTMWGTSMVFGAVADWLILRGTLSVLSVRRLFTTIGDDGGVAPHLLDRVWSAARDQHGLRAAGAGRHPAVGSARGGAVRAIPALVAFRRAPGGRSRRGRFVVKIFSMRSVDLTVLFGGLESAFVDFVELDGGIYFLLGRIGQVLTRNIEDYVELSFVLASEVGVATLAYFAAEAGQEYRDENRTC
ncbi:hypothetical protein FOCC_FOCC005199 [Frankliniella occidentalis]|nr:hypothetical protein FOCC_FOCC005199 [Frankliniella occidentalis]